MDLNDLFFCFILFLLGEWLNFGLFRGYIFSRENKVQTFISGSIG